jgi:cation diffusion facilitator family transporter
MRGFKRFHRNLGIDSQPASLSPVVLAFAIGAAVVVAKTVAAVVTGSASMLAEAMHSWVDAAAEGLLVTSYFMARRPADASHPLGHGRDSYVWSLFASLGMLIVGAEVGVWRGVMQLRSNEAGDDYWFGYLVIAVSLVLEAQSFLQALRFMKVQAAEQNRSVLEHAWKTSDSQLRAVFAEDFVALVTLAIAALGMALHQLTGNVVFDALGSILIGVLMGATGLILINLNRRLLAGMPVTAEQRATILALLRSAPGVTRVTFLFTEFIGPARILLAARVGIAGEHTQGGLGLILRELERDIMTNRHVGQAILTLAAPQEEDL